MNWLSYALLAVVINTTLGLGLRVQTKSVTNPRITGLVYNCFAAITSIIIWIINGAKLPSNIPLSVVGLLILSALGYGIFQRGQFYLRKHVEASQLAPVFQAGVVAGLIASMVILNEPLTPKKIAGAVIILGAVVLINRDNHLTVNKYTAGALFIASAMSIASVIDKLASPHFPLFFYTMLIWMLPLVYIAIPVKTSQIKTAIKEGGWAIPLLASMNALSLGVAVRAFQLGEASNILLLLATTSVATVLGGIVILGERKDWQIKLIAGILVTIGIIILH